MSKFRIWIQNHVNSFRTILIGYIALILVGAVLLMMPFSSANGESVPFLNALFTSTSASCVTGLVVYDTAVQWNVFGKAIILILIQVGGLGVVTTYIATLLLTGKRIGLMQRIAMQDSISAPQLGGIVRFTSFFLKGTAIIELVGALLLWPTFAKDFGLLTGFGYAIFHSISAFCNAGFDLMGVHTPFASLAEYSNSIPMTSVICLLIIIGGIGFLTWSDLVNHKLDFHSMRLQTKLVLTLTAILIVIPSIALFIFEFEDYPLKERILLSIFQAVTPRTAGFSTANYAEMNEGSLLMTIILMIIGGAPGSCAGGIKITTIAVILISSHAYLHGKEKVSVYKRSIEPVAVHNAYTLFVLYIVLLLGSTFILQIAEKLPVMPVMFECASALGTVGLSTGITPNLCAISKIVLICLMFVGRVGGLTLTYAMMSIAHTEITKYPTEKLTVG